MDARTLEDPLGNVVNLPTKFDAALSENDCRDEDASLVIEKPTMVITIPEPSKSLYHLRAVDLGVTVLMKSTWEKEQWVVAEYWWNPASKFVGELMGKGEFVAF